MSDHTTGEYAPGELRALPRWRVDSIAREVGIEHPNRYRKPELVEAIIARQDSGEEQ